MDRILLDSTNPRGSGLFPGTHLQPDAPIQQQPQFRASLFISVCYVLNTVGRGRLHHKEYDSSVSFGSRCYTCYSYVLYRTGPPGASITCRLPTDAYKCNGITIEDRQDTDTRRCRANMMRRRVFRASDFQSRDCGLCCKVRLANLYPNYCSLLGGCRRTCRQPLFSLCRAFMAVLRQDLWNPPEVLPGGCIRSPSRPGCPSGSQMF